MWMSSAPPVTSPSRAVGDALTVLRDEQQGICWSAHTDDELVAVVEQVQQVLVVAAAAVEAGALAEAHARGLPADGASARVTTGGARRRRGLAGSEMAKARGVPLAISNV